MRRDRCRMRAREHSNAVSAAGRMPGPHVWRVACGWIAVNFATYSVFSSTNGSITVNVVPFPTSLSTVMVPLEICILSTCDGRMTCV